LWNLLNEREERQMTRYWLTAVLVQFVGLVLWFTGFQFDLGALMPVALFVGTVIPASLIAIDLGIRFLPTTAARFMQLGLIAVNIAVAVAIVVVHTVASTGSFAFLSAVEIAIYGTVTMGLGLAVLNVSLSLLMARNYLRVASGRQKGIGSLFVAAGTLGLTLPLLVIDLVVQWPLVALPAMIVALMGQRRLDM